MEVREPHGGIVGPVLLIGIGIVFLLNNLGWLNWGVWETLLRLWPVLLIAVGIQVLFGRGSILGSLLAAGLLLAAFVGAILLAGGGGPLPSEAVSGDRFSQPLNGATRAEVNLRFAVGRLRVGAAATGDQLAEGSVRAAGTWLRRDFRVENGTAFLDLRDEFDSGRFLRWSRGERFADVRFSAAIPMRLRVETGAGESELDLSPLTLTDLQVRAGVGRTVITLPARGQLQASVKGGVGETEIRIPAGVAVRLDLETGVGRVEVPDSYSRQGDIYISPGYETATNRVQLEVATGVGRIHIQEWPGA